jgi:hypothetical protein
MQELKPVATLHVIKAPTKHTYKAILAPEEAELLAAGDYPLWDIPDTHRIVPVELLVAAQSVMDTEGFDKEAEELQAIIGKTGQ